MKLVLSILLTSVFLFLACGPKATPTLTHTPAPTLLSDQAYNSDQKAIQAAVDSYYTSPTTRVNGQRQYPTKTGAGTNPTYSAGTWSSDGGFIYFDKIIAEGYMSDAAASAGYQNRVSTGPDTFGSGSYNWYTDPSGRVKAWYWPTPTPTPGTPESGYKSGVFP